ncbi:MAG: integrase, partial [Rhizobiales bacterium]|nr:integrase [Hyphomicrobiales bacterium]
RPSEICNLPPERIHLKAKIPYISVDFQEDRLIKTESSVRDIPLMGVALDVMKRFPKGFPRYRDREDTLSATLMKHLRAKKLLPSDAHRVYSTRHSFEKRMLEAGLDFEFRKAVLGHSVNREKYGDGGSMAWRLEQLRKIELPYDEAIVPGRAPEPQQADPADP